MNKKPEQFNIIKHKGQLNTVRNLHGRMVERADFLFVMAGENIDMVRVVYDDIHFIYQNHMPITPADVLIKYHGKLPNHLIGAHILCTCGAEAVIMLEGPYAGMAMCKAVATLGKHQTSFEVKDQQLILDKKTKDEHYMGDAEVERGMKSQEQAVDENNDSVKTDKGNE